MHAAPRRPSLRRLPRALALLALGTLLLSQNACIYVAGATALGASVGVATAYQPLGELEGKYRPDNALQVSFDEPRVLSALMPGERDSLRVAGATRLVGRVREVRGDTVVLAVTELRRVSGGPMGFGNRREPLTQILPDDRARVEVLTKRASPVQRGVVGAAAGFVLAFLGLLVYCNIERCLG